LTAPHQDSAARLLALAPQRTDTVCARLPTTVSLYCLGGAVRDALLGDDSADHDFLVVGATPQAMLDAGFRPVGRDFPVFLHPTSQAEFALARTERKSGVGYHGFQFQADASVTLEDDLLRRDLTINAMAVDEQGQLHDPHGGHADLQRQRLRHVSPAFQEDPVRLLRLARFMARWPWAEVDPDTAALCARMVDAGEADNLVAERVWQEVLKGLSEVAPQRLVELLVSVGAWPRIMQTPAPTQTRLAQLETLALAKTDPLITAAVLWAEGLPEPMSAVVPKAVHEWAQMLGTGLDQVPLRQSEEPAADWATRCLQWCQRADLFRRPERLGPLIQLGRLLHHQPGHACEQFAHQVHELLQTPVGAVAQQAQSKGQSIAEAVAEARLAQLTSMAGRGVTGP